MSHSLHGQGAEPFSQAERMDEDPRCRRGLLVTTQAGRGSQQEQGGGQFHSLTLQTWTLYDGFPGSRSRVNHSPSSAQVHQTRDTTRRPRQQDMKQRGCKVGLNANGEKYMDFMLSNIVHTFIFSAELRLLLRRHMELLECTGVWVRGQSWRGFGSVLSPVFPWHHPCVLWGSPSEASGIWVWFSWARSDVPPRTAGLRPQPRRGSFGGTKRMAEGSCPDG